MSWLGNDIYACSTQDTFSCLVRRVLPRGPRQEKGHWRIQHSADLHLNILRKWACRVYRGERLACMYIHTCICIYACMHECIDICTYTSERICEVEFSTHPGVGCLKLAYNNALQRISTVLCTVGLVSISLYVLDLLILGLGERASPVFRNKGCFETRCCSLVLLYIVCCRPSTTLQMVKW